MTTSSPAQDSHSQALEGTPGIVSFLVLASRGLGCCKDYLFGCCSSHTPDSTPDNEVIWHHQCTLTASSSMHGRSPYSKILHRMKALITWQQAIQTDSDGKLLQTQGSRQNEIPEHKCLPPARDVPLEVTCAEAHVCPAEVVHIPPALWKHP